MEARERENASEREVELKEKLMTYEVEIEKLHPERRRFQLSPSPVVVILTASDPTYTAVHCW